MFNWEDIEYINPRKKVFKNMDTNEMLNLELQEDPDNILKESKTPLTAYNLNQAQQEVVDDMSKTYTGTNITAPTIEGYGRINKLYGKTEEIGTGEKSPDNPYELKCVGDDVNLFDEKWRQGAYSNNTMLTRVFSASDIKVKKGSYTVITNLDFSKYNISFAASDTPYPAPGPLLADSGWQTKNEITIEIFQDGYLGIGVKKQDESNITPNEMKKYKFRIQNKLRKIETISKNGTNTSSNITYINSPLCSIGNVRDEIDYTKRKITRKCEHKILNGTENWVLDGLASDGYLRFSLANGILMTQGTSINNLLKDRNNEVHGAYEYLYVAGNTVYVHILKRRLSTQDVAGFKTWLSNNNIIMIHVKATETSKDIDCSNKIIQYEEETTIYNRDNAEIEVSLTNNKAISEINEELKFVQDDINNIKEKSNYSIEIYDDACIWAYDTANKRFYTPKKSNKTNKDVISCNLFLLGNSEKWNNTFNYGSQQIFFKTDRFTTTNDFKAFLAETPIIIVNREIGGE